MSNILREIAPDTARKTATELRDLGITIPEEVCEHLENLDRLDTVRPSAVTQADLEAAFIEGQSGAAIRDLAGEVATHAARHSAWHEARIKVARRAVSTFIANGNSLTDDLAKLAEPMIAKLIDTATLDTLDTTALLRDGRTAEAESVARAEIVASKLEGLYRLRDRVTKGAEYGVDQVDCRRWRNPRNLPSDVAKTALDAFLGGIRADAGLWFPLPHQAQEQAAPLAKAERTEAEALRQRSRGGAVAFG